MGFAIELKEKSKEFRDFSVYALPLWGMKYKNLQPKQLSKIEEVVVAEGRLEDGGFGSWLLESSNVLTKAKITLINLDSKFFNQVTSHKKLNFFGGLKI